MLNKYLTSQKLLETLFHECQICMCPAGLTVWIGPPPISHNWWMVRIAPSPFFLSWPWLTYLSWVLSNNLLVPWIAVAWICDSQLVLTHHHYHQLQHLSSSTTHEKEYANSYFRLSLCLFSVRSLYCLELFSNSHLSIFGHQANGPASHLTITRTIWSEWNGAW